MYALLASGPLRDWLATVAHGLKRNKALPSPSGWYFAAFDGHELFASRKRCCPQCLTRTLKLKDREVTEYYHRGVVCHLIGQDLAIPLDVEMDRPGEGEEPAAKRLLERVCRQLRPLLRCRRRRWPVSRSALHQFLPGTPQARRGGGQGRPAVVAAGCRRAVLPTAARSNGPRPRRTVQYWDEEGFTSCEGCRRTVAGVADRGDRATPRTHRRRSGRKREGHVQWYWATTFSKQPIPHAACSGRRAMGAGTSRTIASTPSYPLGPGSLLQARPDGDHQFHPDAVLGVVLLQCFWHRNLKPAARRHWSTLISRAEELYRSLGQPRRAPWVQSLPQPP